MSSRVMAALLVGSALFAAACGKRQSEPADAGFGAAAADVPYGATADANGNGASGFGGQDFSGQYGGAQVAAGGPPQGQGARQPMGAVDLSKLPPGAIALSKATINDPGVIRPGPALFALIPAGWSTQGGVAQQQSPCGEPYVVNWSARSPDGMSSLDIFPTDQWQWSNLPAQLQCREGKITSVRDYLSGMVTQAFPGARVIDYRQRDDFARSAIEQAQRITAMAQNAGIRGMTARAEGGEVLFAFERNGVDMRGVAGVSAIFYLSELPDPMGGAPIGGGTGATVGTFAATAPNGKLDFNLIEAARRSMSPHPDWLQSLFQLKGAIGDAAVRGTRERAAIIVAGGAEATRQNIAAYQQMARNSIKNSNDSIAASQGGIDAARNGGGGEIYPGSNAQDRMQRESIEGVRGVETYHDPIDNSRVQLDMNYDHAWRVNNSDSYILTKDPNFNPGQYGIEATQMGVVQ